MIPAARAAQSVPNAGCWVLRVPCGTPEVDLWWEKLVRTPPRPEPATCPRTPHDESRAPPQRPHRPLAQLLAAIGEKLGGPVVVGVSLCARHEESAIALWLSEVGDVSCVHRAGRAPNPLSPRARPPSPRAAVWT